MDAVAVVGAVADAVAGAVADAVAGAGTSLTAGTKSKGLGSVAVQSVAMPTTKPRSSVLVDASHVNNVSVMVLTSVAGLIANGAAGLVVVETPLCGPLCVAV